MITMDEEDEKKQKKREWGSTVGSIVRIVKSLFNPIVFWTVIIAFFLIIIVGFVSYFKSIPSVILGKINTWISSLGKIFDDGRIKANEEEILNLCTYLEEMGYDVEGYGFVESIEREGEPKYNDNNSNNIATRGKITKVTSKYLEAYIISDKRVYAIANPKSVSQADSNQGFFKEAMLQLAIGDTINSVENVKNFIENYESTNNLTREDTVKGLTAYYSQLYSLDGETPTWLKALAYWIFPWVNEEAKNFETGRKIVETMNKEKDIGSSFEAQFNELAQKYKGEDSQYKYVGDGLIVLENNEGNEYNPIGLTWHFKGSENKDGYDVRIDEPNRYFIVESGIPGGNSLLKALGLGKLTKYAFDLNNWSIKYGKPAEFLIAVHAATMAPDFAYTLATSPAVDTKVHVSLFETGIDLRIVPADGDEESVLSILENAEKDRDITDGLKRIISKQINELEPNYHGDYADKVNAYYQNDVDEGEESIKKPYSTIANRVDGVTYDVNSSFMREQIKKAFHEIRNNELNDKKDISSILQFSDAAGFGENVKKLNISALEVRTDPIYDIIKDLPFGSYKEAINVITDLQSQMTIATPYITKVQKHWYRNQYFTDIGGDKLYDKKQRLNELVKNYIYLLEGNQSDVGNTVAINEETSQKIQKKQEDINKIASEEGVQDYLTTLKDEWGKEKDKYGDELGNKVTKIENEFNAVDKQFKNDSFTGGAYTVEANPRPRWTSIEELISKGSTILDEIEDGAVKELIRGLTVEEIWSEILVQIHNPLFEDNSKHIRNWLREKYVIYDGKSEEVQESGESVVNSTSTEKRYIQGKTALQTIEAQLEDCQDVRSDMQYMLRELKELFQDFEFDLENTETPRSKVLSNIMPAYVPYTKWPSVYEKSENNCTKMIYKGGSATLVAPGKCIIRKAENGVIDMEFVGNDEKSAIVQGMTLRVKAETGTLSPYVGASKDNEIIIEEGTQIASVSSQNGVISIKLTLLSITKQNVRVEDYMDVKHKGYGDLTTEEKMYLYTLLEKEVEDPNKSTAYSQGNAIVNVLFNRISSPFCRESSIAGAIGNAANAQKIGFINYSKNIPSNKDIKNLENNVFLQNAISNALGGADVTKSDTLLGATNYFATDDSYYEGVAGGDEFIKKRDSLKISTTIGNRIFGVTEDEYKQYLGDMIKKKIYEVIYELDISKYVVGFEAIGTSDANIGYDTSEKIITHQEEVFKIFEPKINELISYYENGTFLQECGGIIFEDPDSTVVNMTKRNVYQEVSENDKGVTEVTDHFTLTANANYSVKWTFKYNVGAEGKIITDSIKLEHEPIINI